MAQEESIREKFLKKMTKCWSVLVTASITITVSIIAMVAISEMTSRNQTRADVDLAERNVASRVGNYDSIKRIHAQVEDAREKLDSLMIRGAGSLYETEDCIRRDFKANIARISGNGEADRNSSVGGHAAPDAFASVFSGMPALENLWSSFLQPFRVARNDYLLALIVVCCSVIGAIMVWMRAHDSLCLSSKHVLVGLAAGFITFLALRGGRSVFMLELGGTVPQFDPYGMAFAGVLVGLFTNNAYELLSALVGDLVMRLGAAFGRAEAQRKPVETSHEPADDAQATGTKPLQP